MLIHHDLNHFIPIVLCAGFGTRLKPLTNYIPKVVCPIINKPAAFLNIEIFLKAGFEKVHCNTHYLEQEVRNELTQAAKYYGYDPARIVFWHEEQILETGGGISRIYHELLKKENIQGKDIIVVSGDIISDFPLELMIEKWKNKQDHDYALMCSKETEKTRKDATWVSKDEKYILGFGEYFEKKEHAIPRVFTNHQIIGQELLKLVDIEKKSSIDIFYRKAISIGKNVLNLPFPNKSYWFDIGTPQNYLECINFFENKLRSSLDNNFYFNKNIINYCFQIPENLKKSIAFISNHVPMQSTEQNKIILTFRDLKKNNQPCHLYPLNIFIQQDKAEINSVDNEFLILI